jgi:hypothetical protein
MFSDNETLLVKSGASGAAGGGGGGTVDDATIEAFGADLLGWFDLHPNRTLQSNFADAPNTVGQTFHYLYSRTPSPATLVLDGNWDFERYQMGPNAIGFSRDSDPAAGHGQYLRDSSVPLGNFPTQAFHLHTIIKTHESYTSTSGLFRWGNFILSAMLNSNGGLRFVDAGGNNITLANFTWVPGKVYVISVWRKLDGATPKFYWTIENLTDGTAAIQETTVAGVAYTDGTYALCEIGYQGQYFRHTNGPLIVVNGTSQAQHDNCITYLKQWYGAAEEEEEEEATPAADSQWFVELDVVTEGK